MTIILSKSSIKKELNDISEKKFNNYALNYIGVLIRDYIEPIVLTATTLHDRRNARRPDILKKKLVTEEEVHSALRMVYKKDNNG